MLVCLLACLFVYGPTIRSHIHLPSRLSSRLPTRLPARLPTRLLVLVYASALPLPPLSSPLWGVTPRGALILGGLAAFASRDWVFCGEGGLFTLPPDW